jgi:hypothetical protein
LSNDVALARYFSNNQPLADAGADQTVLAGQSVTLDGSASTDPDGDPLTYAWTLTGPGSPALSDNAAVQPTFCAAESGLYTATLTVNDGFEDSPPDAALITALSATEALDQAMTAVDDLVSEGTLNSGQAGALKRKLRQAQRLLAKGQPGEALMVLADYRMQLEDLHDEDVLNDDQQQTLADAAGAITGVLEAPCSAAAAKGAGQATASDDTPQSYRLGSYPNPFNPAATVAFALPERAAVSLAVYDVLGREVARLVEGSLEAGAHAVRFEAGALPSGTYLVRLEAGAQVRTHRVVLLK